MVLNIPAFRVAPGDVTRQGTVSQVRDNGDTVTLFTNRYPSGYTFATNERVGLYVESD